MHFVPTLKDNTAQIYIGVLIRPREGTVLLARMANGPAIFNRLRGEYHFPGTGVSSDSEAERQLCAYFYDRLGIFSPRFEKIVTLHHRVSAGLDGNEESVNRYVRHVFVLGYTPDEREMPVPTGEIEWAEFVPLQEAWSKIHDGDSPYADNRTPNDLHGHIRHYLTRKAQEPELVSP